jgi:CelD/BcsL family acetyltransferase involved in cellulose biosynthesis
MVAVVGTLVLEWLQGEAALLSLAPAWDALAAADGTPFSRHAWFLAWWQAFGGPDDAALRICTAWDAGELVAALPCVAADQTLRAASNSESELHPPHRDEQALAAVLRAAYAEAGREMTLAMVPLEAPVGRAAIGTARAAGRVALVGQVGLAPVVSLDGTWEDYRERMRSKWGSIERKGRKLRREHDAGVSLVQPPADLGAQLARGLALEQGGWKGREGTAILDRAQYRRFYEGLAHGFAATGDLRLSEIVLDGELVAFDLAMLTGNRLYSVKTAYSEAHARLSPGMVMRTEMIERCFDEGLEAHELLGVALPWKLRFATATRPVADVTVLHRGPRAWGRMAYHGRVRPQLRRAYVRWVKPARDRRRAAARRPAP